MDLKTIADNIRKLAVFLAKADQDPAVWDHLPCGAKAKLERRLCRLRWRFRLLHLEASCVDANPEWRDGRRRVTFEELNFCILRVVGAIAEVERKMRPCEIVADLGARVAAAEACLGLLRALRRKAKAGTLRMRRGKFAREYRRTFQTSYVEHVKAD